MTVPRLNKIYEYWRYEVLPLNKALSAFVGYKPSPRPDAPVHLPSKEVQAENLKELMSMFPMRPPPLPRKRPGDSNV